VRRQQDGPDFQQVFPGHGLLLYPVFRHAAKTDEKRACKFAAVTHFVETVAAEAGEDRFGRGPLDGDHRVLVVEPQSQESDAILLEGHRRLSLIPLQGRSARCHHSDDCCASDSQRQVALPILATCLIGLLATGLRFTTSQDEAAEHSTGSLTLKFGPGVYRFKKSDEHNNQPWLVGAAWEYPSGLNVGAAHFRNSFNQPSQYLYVGKRWFPDVLCLTRCTST